MTLLKSITHLQRKTRILHFSLQSNRSVATITFCMSVSISISFTIAKLGKNSLNCINNVLSLIIIIIIISYYFDNHTRTKVFSRLGHQAGQFEHFNTRNHLLYFGYFVNVTILILVIIGTKSKPKLLVLMQVRFYP